MKNVESTNKRTFEPTISRRRNKNYKIDMTFIPLICNKIYKDWIELELKTPDYTRQYNEAKNAFIDKKKGDNTKEKEELEKQTQKLTQHVQLTESLLFKFIGIVVEDNENPEEWATREWIERNFTDDDLGSFVREALTAPDDETKKKSLRKMPI